MDEKESETEILRAGKRKKEKMEEKKKRKTKGKR